MKNKQLGQKANGPKKDLRREEMRAWQAVERGRKASEKTGEWQIGLLPKKSISIRVEPVIIDWFKAQGGNYQTLMRRVLKQYAADNTEAGITQDARKVQRPAG